MKRILYISIAMCINCVALSSQAPISGVVTYQSKHKMHDFSTHDYSLLFKNGITEFSLQPHGNHNQDMHIDESEMVLTIDRSYPDSLYPYQIIDTKSKVVYEGLPIRQFDQGYFIHFVKDQPELNWEIKNKFRRIGAYQCQLARLHFRGRSYEAWFSLEIRVPYGPFKFFGLPGLILEIYDTKREVYFAATSILLGHEEEFKKRPLHRLESSEFLSREEYYDLVEKSQQKDSDEFLQRLQSKLPRGVTMTVDSVEKGSDAIELDHLK